MPGLRCAKEAHVLLHPRRGKTYQVSAAYREQGAQTCKEKPSSSPARHHPPLPCFRWVCCCLLPRWTKQDTHHCIARQQTSHGEDSCAWAVCGSQPARRGGRQGGKRHRGSGNARTEGMPGCLRLGVSAVSSQDGCLLRGVGLALLIATFHEIDIGCEGRFATLTILLCERNASTKLNRNTSYKPHERLALLHPPHQHTLQAPHNNQVRITFQT